MIMAHPNIVGRENLRDVDGPLLISCNHVTYIDVGFALLALPPRLRRKLAVGMWGELLWEMWRPPQTWNPFLRLSYKVGYYLVVALFNVFPLAAAVGSARELRLCRRIGRSRLQRAGLSRRRAHARWQAVAVPLGVGMLAARLNIPVLPLRIDGLYEMKMAGHKIARPGELKVVIGKPMRFPPETPPEEITNQLEHVTWKM